MKNKEIFVKRHDSVLQMDDTIKNKRERYCQAMRNKTVLLGESHDGISWAHYNYMLSVVKFKKCNSMLDAVREFWKNFFPYLSNLMTAYLEVKDMLYMEWDEHNKILKEYSEAVTEQKLRKEFICRNDMEGDYEHFKNEFQCTARAASKEEISQRTKKD